MIGEGNGYRCKECLELCLILGFYHPIIGIPLCLHDLGLKCNYEL